jgi:Helicase conserved C-terminal domain
VEIAETVASRQEKLLVFTQFKEIIPPLERLLAAAFSHPGLALHGETAVGKRKDLVKKFQEDETVPFFILSLKAGGAGLNLTAASHVAISTVGGTPPSKTKRLTAPSALGRSAMSSYTNSFVAARSRSESTR